MKWQIRHEPTLLGFVNANDRAHGRLDLRGVDCDEATCTAVDLIDWDQVEHESDHVEYKEGPSLLYSVNIVRSELQASRGLQEIEGPWGAISDLELIMD